MLSPEQMSRVLIAAPKDVMEPVISELHRQRLFHIEDFVENDEEEYAGYRIGVPLEGAKEISKDLLRLRSVTGAFSLRAEDLDPSGKIRKSQLTAQIEQELPGIEMEVEELLSRRTELENHVKELEQKIEALTPFSEMRADLALLHGYRTLAVFAGYLSKKVDIGVPCEEYYSESKKGNFLVAVVPVEYRQEVERKLLDAQFQTVPVPDESGPAKERISVYNVQIETDRKDLEEIATQLDALKSQYSEFLIACDELLSIDAQKAEVPLRFATTDHAFIADGWVPSHTLSSLTDGINAVSGGRAFVAKLPIQKERDVVPVEYDNINFAKPTQFLMDIYSRPKYTELDPTLIVAIVFPIFFGLILGDVGYGALLLVASFGLRKLLKGSDGKMLLDIMRNASISSIFFGILFSEIFGFKLPWAPILPSRHLNIGGEGGHGPAIPELMIMCVWIGIIHITAGRILGILNHARRAQGGAFDIEEASEHHGNQRSHHVRAMLANLGWIMVMWGILVMIWSAFPMPLMPDLTGFAPLVMGLTLPLIIGILLVVPGVVFIFRESALELVELPTILSHVLSYARLVGVGVSSVAIAMVINFITIGLIIEPQLENLTIFGAIIIAVGVIVWIIGQILNTILGMIGGGLQSLRLQYVEFFTKFYKGGGKKYSPFGEIRRFTED
ncbi:MAG: V-type ATP synthase subunit I [Methanomicrobiales archaeon]|nr:V-type ATP synthase subunit I [Methanomicrobiales archaeon]